MRTGTPGFVGSRLRAAREARGIATAAGLAEMLGVSRAAVSQYERGDQTPSPDVMRSISEVLNLPVHHFLKPAPDPADSIPTFFRSMASATKGSRLRANRKCDWVREIVLELKRVIRFPKVDFPEFDLPRNPLKITDDMIEEAATALRRHWSLGDGPISNVAWLLENKGAVVVRLDLDSDKLDAFSKWHDHHAEPYVVLGTNKATASRQRFNAAHELGHLALHRRLSHADLTRRSVFSEVERQAHRFAGAFLLPERMFLADLYSRTSLDAMRSVKPKWKVSIALMLKRAEDLGVIPESHAKALWINLSRRGWRRKEPLDETLSIEKPRFLERCFTMLLDKGLLTQADVTAKLALSAKDIEDLANLPAGLLGRQMRDTDIRETPAILRFPRQRSG